MDTDLVLRAGAATRNHLPTCHSGHCEQTSTALPRQLAVRNELPLVTTDAGPCCAAVAAVEDVSAGCACCATALA